MNKLIRNPSNDLGFEFFLALRNAGLDNELAEMVINNPAKAKAMVDAIKTSVDLES